MYTYVVIHMNRCHTSLTRANIIGFEYNGGENDGIYLSVAGLSLKGTSVHKQTLCGQTAGGLGCGEMGEKTERGKRLGAVSESGRSVSGCGTIIPLRGVAVVF